MGPKKPNTAHFVSILQGFSRMHHAILAGDHPAAGILGFLKWGIPKLFPNAPCMEYLPTKLGHFGGNVGKMVRIWGWFIEN